MTNFEDVKEQTDQTAQLAAVDLERRRVILEQLIKDEILVPDPEMVYKLGPKWGGNE